MIGSSIISVTLVNFLVIIHFLIYLNFYVYSLACHWIFNNHFCAFFFKYFMILVSSYYLCHYTSAFFFIVKDLLMDNVFFFTLDVACQLRSSFGLGSGLLREIIFSVVCVCVLLLETLLMSVRSTIL